MRSVLAILVFAALSLALAGCEMKTDEGAKGGRRGGRPGAGGGDGEEKGENRIPVRAATARRESMARSIEASAPLEALHAIEVHSEVSGRVKERNVELGQRVEPDQVLFVLHDPEILRRKAETSVARAQKKTAHEKALVRLEEIDSEIATVRLDIEELAGKAPVLAGQLERDRATYQDKLRLRERNLIPKGDLDSAKSAVEATERELDQNRFERQRKELTLADLEGIEKERARLEVETARLDLEAQDMVLAQIEVDITHMTIRAPAAGVATVSEIQLGQWVTKETALVVLVLLDPIVSRVRLPEREIPLVRVGQTVVITSPTLDAMNVSIAGHVAEISGLVDATSGTIECLVEVDGNDPNLRPGMLVRCRIEVFKDEDAIVVPKRSVLYERGESFVFKVVDGKAVRTRVEIGVGRENEIAVTSGLAEGDRVVTVGNKTLQDGTLIEVIEE